MALDTNVKNFAQGTITLSDGTGSPVSLILTLDKGTLAIEGLKKVLRETVKYERRGLLHTVSLANRIYPTLSFEAMVSEFSNASAGVVTDFLLGNAAYSANVSTLGSSHLVFTCKLTFDLEGTDTGGNDSQVVCDDVDFTFNFSEGDPNMFSISGEILGAVTGDLAAAET